jgi:hypothetical protein
VRTRDLEELCENVQIQISWYFLRLTFIAAIGQPLYVYVAILLCFLILPSLWNLQSRKPIPHFTPLNNVNSYIYGIVFMY